MPYVGSDGTVGGSKSIKRTITDFFSGIIDIFCLFFTAVTNPPQRLEANSTVGFVD
jgi:hypothetical protein